VLYSRKRISNIIKHRSLKFLDGCNRADECGYVRAKNIGRTFDKLISHFFG
jgi:hypothetical protein